MIYSDTEQRISEKERLLLENLKSFKPRCKKKTCETSDSDCGVVRCYICDHPFYWSLTEYENYLDLLLVRKKLLSGELADRREAPRPKDVFSSCCGTPLIASTYPRECLGCHNLFWDNPIPVVVVLQPVVGNAENFGLVVIRRAIPPCVGELALPGGFLEVEPWAVGAGRELWEEGIAEIPSTMLIPFKPFPYASSANNQRVLLFSIATPIRERDLPLFRPNTEVSERVIIWGPTELCFTTHTEAVRQFFNWK